MIYVDSRHIHPIQKEEILQLFEILAGHAAFAIRNARLYENLQTAYNELREANEHIIRSERMAMRGEIAGEVSHELNNILSVALCQCYALQRHLRKSENPDADNALKQITLSLRRMTNFSENLLVGTSNNSKMEAVHFNTVIKNFVAFISVLPKFKKALIHTEFDEELNDVQIDVDQFQQVLLNIANNAMDAKYNANLSFRTEYDFVKNIARLSISDDGPGIDPKIREKLFTERITTKPDGHGFGLPLCKKIIQNHHGEISVDSEPGFGTRFIMAFPIPI